MVAHSVFGATAPPGNYAYYSDGTPSIALGQTFYATSTIVGGKIIGGRIWIPAGVGGGTATCSLRLAVKTGVNSLDTAAVQTKTVSWSGDTKWVDAVFDTPQDIPAVGVRWMISWQHSDPFRYVSSLDFRAAPGAAFPARDGSPIVLSENDQPSAPNGPVRDRYYRFGTDAPGHPAASEGGYGMDTLIDIPDAEPENVVPTGNGGANRTVFVGQPVTLTGTGADTDGTIASSLWVQTSGPSVTLGGSGATRTFTPTIAGVYVFAFSVTDNDGATSIPDPVTVTVQELPPEEPETPPTGKKIGKETITVIRKAKVDRLASPTGGPPPEHDIEGCVVTPRTSHEEGKGWVIVEGRMVVAPFGSDILATDQVRYEDLVWEVDGAIGSYKNKRGKGKAVIVYLTRQGS